MALLTMSKLSRDSLFRRYYLLGTFIKDDADGNENGKQQGV